MKHSPIVPRLQGQPTSRESPKITNISTPIQELTPVPTYGNSPSTLPGVTKHPVAPNFDRSSSDEFNSSLFNLGIIDPPPADDMAENRNNPLPNPLGGLDTLEALLRALNDAPRVPLPTYAGVDHEDPNKFLTDCEEYFASARIPNAA